MATVAATIVALAVAVVAAEPAGACSCAGDLLAHRDEATAIFAGAVTASDEIELDGPPPGWSGANRQLTVAVDRVWKGEVFERQAVVVPSGASSSCGVRTDVGGDLLVFAFDDRAIADALPDGVYSAGLCTTEWLSGRAATLPMLGGELDELGTPRVAATGASPRATSVPFWRSREPGNVRLTYAIGATGGVAVAGAVLVVLRARARSRRAT